MPTPDFIKRPIQTFPDGKHALHPELLACTVSVYDVDGAATDNAKEAQITTPRLMCFSAGHSRRDDPSDLKTIVKYLGDPENMKLNGPGKPLAEDVATAFHAAMRDRWAHGNIFSSFSVDAEDGSTIGQAMFRPPTPEGKCEYGILLDKKYHGNGYGTETTVAFSYFWTPHVQARKPLCPDIPLQAITATTHPANGTVKIFERLGYTHVDTLESSEYPAPQNIYELSLDRVNATMSHTRRLYL